jgi:ribonuclease HI
MYFNGSFTLNGGRGGIMLIAPKGDCLFYISRLHFCVTNNVADNKALVNSLYIAAELGVQRLYICGDTRLIVSQVMGESNYCDSYMAAYRQEVRNLEERIDSVELHHIL